MDILYKKTDTWRCVPLNLLSANFTKWSNTPKQFVDGVELEIYYVSQILVTTGGFELRPLT